MYMVYNYCESRYNFSIHTTIIIIDLFDVRSSLDTTVLSAAVVLLCPFYAKLLNLKSYKFKSI